MQSSKLRIGTNYWPATTGVHMWERFQAEAIAEELRSIAEAGLQIIRFFLMTPSFWRQGKPVISAFENYRRFWQLLEEAGLKGIPTLFVGHMSGANWEVSGWNHNRFYTDEHVKVEQKSYLAKVLEYTPPEAPVYAWCLTNELPMYQPGNSPDEVTAWVRDMLEELKSHHSAPVYLGDGGWAPEILGWNHNHHLEAAQNFPLRKLASTQDFLALHFYPRTADDWLHAWEPAYRLTAARAWHTQVNVGEFGCSVTMASEANQASYYREVLFSALVGEAQMALSWCWSDFDLPEDRPYNDHPFELRFGLQALDGHLRPSLKAMHTIAELSEDIAKDNLERVSLPWALMLPAAFYQQVSFDWDLNVPGKHGFYVNVLGCLKSTGWNPEIVCETVEEDGEAHASESLSRVKLLILPRWKRMMAPTQKRLLNWVAEGGVLYASYAIDHWILDLESVLGIETDLRFGIPDYYPRHTVGIKRNHPWGFFEGQFELPVSRDDREDAWLPIKNSEGEVLLHDSQGNPLLIKRRWGQGYIFYSALPWEVWAWRHKSSGWREFLVRLYASLILDVFHPPYLCLTPGGEFLPLQSGKDEFPQLYLFNHRWEETEFELLLFNSRGELSRTQVSVPAKDLAEFSFTTLTQEGG